MDAGHGRSSGTELLLNQNCAGFPGNHGLPGDNEQQMCHCDFPGLMLTLSAKESTGHRRTTVKGKRKERWQEGCQLRQLRYLGPQAVGR